MRPNGRKGKLLLIAAAWAASAAGVAEIPSSADPTLQQGKAIYETHCSFCHGVSGRGDGEASRFLLPKPSNLATGGFKLRSTPQGLPPTDEDLFRTITRGIPNSAMPSFAFLSRTERHALIRYVKLFSATSFAQTRSSRTAASVDRTSRFGKTAATIAAGKSIYDKLQCASCHGVQGHADGPVANLLQDELGLPIKPRNLATEPFKGGHSVRDIYLRITTGMEGSPMPAFADQASEEQRWQLAYYVQSLCKATCEVAASDGAVVSKHVAKLPDNNPVSPVWRKAPRVRVVLSSLWNRGTPPPTLSVRSLNDGRTIAFLLEWSDSGPDTRFERPEDFRDAVAIQFTHSAGRTSLAMGNHAEEVTIWHWKADWQEHVDRGHRTDVADIHPWMIHEPYPGPVITALDAGNLSALRRRTTPAEEATARGFGTLMPRPVADQKVMGKGIWSGGLWHVVLSRKLDLPDRRPTLANGTRLAFAVWDGSERERDGQKAISSWYALGIESQ